MALATAPIPRSKGFLDLLTHKAPSQSRAIEIYRRLLSIIELAAAMNATRDVEHLQSELGRAFQEWTPQDSVRLCIVDGSCYRRSRLSGPDIFGEEGAFSIDCGIAGSVLKSGMPLWVTNISDAWPRPESQDTKPSTSERCFIVLPFTALGKVVGALELVSDTPDRFDEIDFHLAFLVTAHLSSALENVLTRQELATANARLRDHDIRLTEMNNQLQQLAHTDDLTGLYNKRRLLEQLNSEIARARRYGEIMSCLMIDVDDFKMLNDSMGHPAGDEALRQIAEILRKSVRITDFVARYGGEEFTVLLPRTDANGARRVAENLCASIKAHRFKLDPPARSFTLDPAALEMTVSIGIASCTKFDNLEGQQVLLRADNALYRAKRAGKDRVCCSEEMED